MTRFRFPGIIKLIGKGDEMESNRMPCDKRAAAAAESGCAFKMR
ncbi:hypothetical protein HMPREF3293_02257 [Christensenella minuta]|uniref:Uncharacterized protein n=1 Tax=Christensenella minuta TaxID=626937 RepID=A0A136Q2U4_9FIRM|nr:hypothetical protein HMPREF3293_02257 [Christensenella minuta]